MADATKAHWIIVSDEGTSSKPHKHDIYDSAYNESVRLSKLKPGINFTIFKATGNTFTVKPVEPETKHTLFNESHWYTIPTYDYRYAYRIPNFHL